MSKSDIEVEQLDDMDVEDDMWLDEAEEVGADAQSEAAAAVAADGGDDDDDEEGEDDEEGMGIVDDVEDPSTVRFEGHGDSVYAIAVHPSRPWALSGGGDDCVRLWSLVTGKAVARLPEPTHEDSVVDVGFSSDGAYFASAGLDHVVYVWRTPREEEEVVEEAETEKEEGGGAEPRAGGGGARRGGGVLEVLHKLEGPSEDIEFIRWHPRAPALIVGGQDCMVWLFDAAKGTCLHVLAGHEGGVSSGAWLPSGKQFVSVGDDAQLRLWSAKSGECKFVLASREPSWLGSGAVSVAIHPDPSRNMCIVGGRDGSARLVSFAAKKPIGTLWHRDPREDPEVEISVEGVGFSSYLDTQWVATGATDGSVKLWELTTLACRASWTQKGSITKLEWVPGRPFFITGAADGTVHIYDARAPDPLTADRLLPAHTTLVLDMVLWLGPLHSSPDETDMEPIPGLAIPEPTKEWYILTAGDDNTCAVLPSSLAIE